MADSDSIKLCECGCGQPAPIAKQTVSAKGYAKGQPLRFVIGHHNRVRQPLHGHGSRDARTGAYHSWRGMIQRCENPNAAHFDRYGGRGIKVCEQWHSFERFLADMGERPEGTSLDRFPDNDGDYEPGNCRWATRSRQLANTSRNKLLTAFGRTQTLKQWSVETAIRPQTIASRLKSGWAIERALTERPARARVEDDYGRM